LRILVVDDLHDTADSTALLLGLLGHEVRAAYDSPTARQVAGTFLPQAVLLDIGLPGMDGCEVARHLRGQAGLEAAAHACGGVLGLSTNACGYVLGQAAGVKTVIRAGWQLAKRFKARLLVACSVGAAAGVATILVGPWLGVAAASAGGFCATLAVKGRAGLRKLICLALAFP
jgi:CheY-like chemotaxis protein